MDRPRDFNQNYVDCIIWRVCMGIWDSGLIELQEHVYIIGNKIQTQKQAFLEEEQEITDSWDLEESLEILENMQVMRGIMAAIL